MINLRMIGVNLRGKTKPPIFLIGSGRSGTTLLMKILNSVPDIMIYGEHGGFLKQIADAYFMNKNDKDIIEHISKEEPPKLVFKHKYIMKIGYSWLNWYGKKTIKYNFKKFIESFFNPKALKKSVHWGFKEIRYCNNDQVIEMLIDIYPNAKFIFITRHPMDVIASQLAMGKWGGFDEILATWKTQNHHMSEFLSNNQSNCFNIEYKDMIKQKSGKLEELFNWLGFKISSKQYDIIKNKKGIWKIERADGKPHREMFTKEQILKIGNSLHIDINELENYTKKKLQSKQNLVEYKNPDRHNIFLPEYKTVYFFIPKVASSSLKKLCASLLGINQETGFHKMDFPSVRRSSLLNNDQYFKFALVRNPYDRLVSCYIQKVKNENNFGKLKIWANKSFEEFIRIVCALPDKEMNRHFKPQHTFLTDAKGKLLVDYIGKLENIKEDFKIISEKAGFPKDMKLPYRLRTNHNHYSTYYTEETKKLVTDRYKKDLEMFNYSF